MRLSAFLYDLRRSKRLTLREVEALTDGKISNAYLCQIERGRVKQPSPGILFALAEAYSYPYEELMELAGYASVRGSKEYVGCATNSLGKLSKEEEIALLDFLGYLRAKPLRKE